MFASFVPVLSSTLDTLGLFTPASSCCGSTLLVLSLVLSSLCPSILLCHICAMGHVYVCMDHKKFLDGLLGQCPRRSLVSMLWSLRCCSAVKHHWSMSNVLHVSCNYSAQLQHSHLVQLPSVVTAVAFNDHTMHPRTTVFHLDITIDPAEKNVESLPASLFLLYASCLDY